MTEIIRFLKSSLIFLLHDYFYNLCKTLFLGPKIYTDAVASLDQAIAEFDQALLLQATVKMLQIPQQQNSPQLQRTGLVSWLESAYWETESQLTTNYNLRASGTTKWILESKEFKEWRLSSRASRSSSQSLWLHGLPGIGKSVIAAYLIQVLRAQYPKAIVLYFFCKAGESGLNSASHLISTLAIQLSVQVPEAERYLQKLKNDDYKPNQKSLSYLTSSLVGEPLQKISQEIFLVIDGLDECLTGGSISHGDEQSSFIRDLIQELQKMNVNFLLTSRATPDISAAMHGCTDRQLTFDDSKEDIEGYVINRVAKSPILKAGFSRIKEDPNNAVTKKSQGSFLWVSIILNLLEKTKSKMEFETCLKTLPDGIRGLYDQIFYTIDQNGDLDMVLTILDCVLCSLRPLTIEELQVAIDILHEGDVLLDLAFFLKSTCATFISIYPSQIGSTVHIAHETFWTYATGMSSSQKAFPRNLEYCHVNMAIVCLKVFTNSNNDSSEPLKGYAAKYLILHFLEYMSISSRSTKIEQRPQGAECEMINRLLLQLTSFFGRKLALRRWMQCEFLSRNQVHQVLDISKFVISVHNETKEWIRIQETSSHIKPLDYSQNDTMTGEKVLIVNKEILALKDNWHAENIIQAFCWVWLNTNWLEYERATIVFDQLCASAKDLQVIKGAVQRDGMKRYSSGYISTSELPLDEVNKLAILGEFNSSVGIQSGNYAVGCMAADSEKTVESYHAAIDEHPDWWHLHEGLGRWYQMVADDKAAAVKHFGEAMKYDPKQPPSCALDCWLMIAKMKEEEDDVDAAVDALRQGEALVTDEHAHEYWWRIAKIYEKKQDYTSIKKIYREAISKRSSNVGGYWKGLANAYKNCGDWRGEIEVFHEAIRSNRDVRKHKVFREGIIDRARWLRNHLVFIPAIQVLRQASEKHPEGALQYNHELAQTYMAARQWESAIPVWQLLWESGAFEYCNEDLGHAYLGAGDIERAIEAYTQQRKQEISAGDCRFFAETVAPAYMIAKDYTQAIRYFKADINNIMSKCSGQPQHYVQACELFTYYRGLGLCYDKLNRHEEANNAFREAVDAYTLFEERDVEMSAPPGERKALYRTRARPVTEVALVLERLGDREGAKKYLSIAHVMFERTAFVGDDEVLEWEREQCQAALERVCSPESGERLDHHPDLEEEIGSMRLERRLSRPYLVNFSGYLDDVQPGQRYRCDAREPCEWCTYYREQYRGSK